MKLNFLKTSLLVATTLFFSCSKDDEAPTVTNPAEQLKGIFITGYTENAQGVLKGVVWNDGVIKEVTPDPSFFPSNIAVEGNDVYVCGRLEGVGKYYKNGTPTILQSSSYCATSDMKIVNNDVYICGEDGGKVCYWKNGIKTAVSSVDSRALSIEVLGNDVYIFGDIIIQSTVRDKATLWKNQTVQDIGIDNNSHDSRAGGMCKNNNDIYVTYNERFFSNSNKLPYLKKLNANGNTLLVSDGIDVLAGNIFISDNDIYVVGSEYINNNGLIGRSRAILWKNNQKQIIDQLDNSKNYYASKFILKDNVSYLLGGSSDPQRSSSRTNIIWKNGILSEITLGQNIKFYPRDFVVK